MAASWRHVVRRRVPTPAIVKLHGSGSPETKQFYGIFLQDKRSYVRLDVEGVEVPQPPVGSDDRPIGPEQHFMLQQTVGVSHQDRREIFRRPARQIDVHVWL